MARPISSDGRPWIGRAKMPSNWPGAIELDIQMGWRQRDHSKGYNIVQLVSTLGATIAIVQGDCKGHRRGRSRRCVLSRLASRLLRRGITYFY